MKKGVKVLFLFLILISGIFFVSMMFLDNYSFFTGEVTANSYSDLWGKMTGEATRIPHSTTPKILPSTTPKIEECTSLKKPFTILFVNINDAPYFNELVDDIIQNQLKVIPPFNKYFRSMSFYRLNITLEDTSICTSASLGLGGSGFQCDNSVIHTKIMEKCPINPSRTIILAFLESEYGGSGGEIIYLGTSSTRNLQTQLALSKNAAIHEIGHNFGLADLYYGTYYSDGRPSQFWDTPLSRSFYNVDGPGCKKWCGARKDVSEYSSACLDFTDKDQCISYAREPLETGGTGGYCSGDCCVWSDQKFEYFNTNCVPTWGTEDIGLRCLRNSGCYFGAVYGNYAWRPVLNNNQSIMFRTPSNKFNTVEERHISNVFKCCYPSISGNNLDVSCMKFRRDFINFLKNYNFKKTIGSCSYLSGK